jgi:hypothetical protein
VSLTFAPAPAGQRPARCSCDELACEPFACPACGARLNLNAVRGMELVQYVGLPAEDGGREPAARVIELCTARLASLAVDPGYPASVSPRAVVGGRAPGALRDMTAQLLEVAHAAGSGDVVWW